MCAPTSSRLDNFSDIADIYCNDNNIFMGEVGHFGGEASTPQIP